MKIEHADGGAVGKQQASSKIVKLPNAEHPIHIELELRRVIVTVGDLVVADTNSAIVLREAQFAPVYYFPPEDVHWAGLERTELQTYCPYKGDCAYYSIVDNGVRSLNAAWSYERPYPAVSPIRGYLAFYSDRVDAIEVVEPDPVRA